MTTTTSKTHTKVGYAHTTVLVFEHGDVPNPTEVYPTLEAYYAANTVEDDYDLPVKVTLTYELPVFQD